MSVCNYEIRDSLGFLTITTNRLMNAYFRKRLLGDGMDLTAEQWGVLVMIWERGNIAQDDLAHSLCVDKSSLSRVLDVLERRGLVTRKRDPDDARRKILYPTADSERFKEACYKAADKSMDMILQDIPEEEHLICRKVLKQVKVNLRKFAEGNAE